MRRAGAILATLLVAGAVGATEITPAERRSGYSFMTPETRAIQDDETANPGLLWVLDGEALWKLGEFVLAAKRKTAETSMADYFPLVGIPWDGEDRDSS